MMDYDFISSLGTLAFEPYCLGNDYLYGQTSTHTDQLIDDSLFFNGFNIFEDAECKKIENGGKEEIVTLDNIDVDAYASNYSSLDNVVLDGNAEISSTATSSLGSPASLSSSIGSLDDLLDDLTSPFGSPISSVSSCPQDDLATPFASPVSSCLDDLEFLENFDLIGNVGSNASDAQLSLPNQTMSSIGEMFSNFASSDVAVSSSAKTKAAISEHTDNETLFDTLSPKSDYSELSSSDEVNTYDFTQNTWQNNPLPSNNGFFVYSTSVPKEVDFSVSKQTVSNPIKSSALPCQSGNLQKGTQRFAPYKGKGRNKTEEQVLRKKEHNRKSASKYRAKKKEQFGNVFGELEQMEEKNKNLKTNVEELRKEIDYLKSLMLDVINARLSKQTNVGLNNLLTTLVN